MEWIDEKLSVLHPSDSTAPDGAWAKLRAKQRQRRQRLVVAGGALSALAAAAAFPPSRAVAKRCVDACGDLLGLRTENPLEGLKSVDLPALRGQVVLVNFWATWCRPCELEIPWFVEMQSDLGPRGLRVVGVCMDEKQDGVPAFLKRHRVNYPVVHDKDFPGVKALPATFLLHRNGKVAFVHEGLVPKEIYLREINGLLAAK